MGCLSRVTLLLSLGVLVYAASVSQPQQPASGSAPAPGVGTTTAIDEKPLDKTLLREQLSKLGFTGEELKKFLDGKRVRWFALREAAAGKKISKSQLSHILTSAKLSWESIHAIQGLTQDVQDDPEPGIPAGLQVNWIWLQEQFYQLN